MKIFVIIYFIYLAFEGVIGFRKDLKYLGNRIYGLPNKEAGWKVHNWHKGDKINPEELGGYAEGDILFTGSLKNGWAWEQFRWPEKKIPYIISKIGFTDADRAMIQSSINDINNHTCIRFVPRTKERVYVQFTSYYAGCYSSVGYTGQSYNVNLQSPGCTSVKGTILHELIHVIGFVHEQSRTERDDYVTIKWGNVASSDFSNFQKYPKSYMKYYDVPYDYHSVMHYSRYALSKNGEETIVPKDKSITKLGQRDGISKGDILKINRMYKCNKSYAAKQIAQTKHYSGTFKTNKSTNSKRSDSTYYIYCWNNQCWRIKRSH